MPPDPTPEPTPPPKPEPTPPPKTISPDFSAALAELNAEVKALSKDRGEHTEKLAALLKSFEALKAKAPSDPDKKAVESLMEQWPFCLFFDK